MRSYSVKFARPLLWFVTPVPIRRGRVHFVFWVLSKGGIGR